VYIYSVGKREHNNDMVRITQSSIGSGP